MTFKKQLTKEQALQKLRHYCGYQERCHSEVKEKLYELGVSKIHHDEIIATLIEENYLNEERFAILFAGGKFRIKQWGKQKIKYELKQRQVSSYSINKALKTIDEDMYRKTLQKLATQKLKTLKTENNLFIKNKKVYNFLTQKGFEQHLVAETISLIKG
jgi:regulatory protein